MKQKQIKKFYRAKNGQSYLGYWTEPVNEEWYDEITEEEYLQYLNSLQPSAEQLRKKEIRREIAQLKSNLVKSDYCVIKIAEGVATSEEYAEILTQRQQWRARINELEK